MTLHRGARRSFIEPKEDAPINWRRGLFRVWLLTSAAWIMSWAIYSILHAMSDGFKTVGDFLSIPVVFFGPPIAHAASFASCLRSAASKCSSPRCWI